MENKSDVKDVNKEIIPAEEVMKPVGGDKGSEELKLTPLQDRGMRLAIGVGIFGAVSTLLILIAWLVMTLVLPNQADAALERAMKLFDSVVVKVAVPLFSTIVAYLFGRQDATGK